jgi:hypothetical protein
VDLWRATIFILRDRWWLPKLLGLGIFASVPGLGQLVAFGYVLGVLRRQVAQTDDAPVERPLPVVRIDWHLLWEGVRVAVVLAISGVTVGLIGSFLFFAAPATFDGVGPLLVQVADHPTNFVIVLTTFVLFSAAFARLAVTDSVVESFRPAALWRLLRSEPALWVASTLVALLLTGGPSALVWIAPWTDNSKLVGAFAVNALLWPWTLLIQAHLIGQAYRWSLRSTGARRAAVRFRW